MIWLSTSVTVERSAVEMIADLFSEYGKNGFTEEELTHNSVNDTENTSVDSTLSKQLVKVSFYREMDSDLAGTLHAIDEVVSRWKQDVVTICQEGRINLFEEPQITCIDETDWQQSWKSYIKPLEILPNVIIQPAWQEYSKSDNETVITIASESSFGTGTHETTQSCAKLISLYGDEKHRILDIGTGTGILLLVVAALFSKDEIELTGVDIDPVCVEQARDNCKENAVSATILAGDLVDVYEGKADLILANLTGDPLKILLPICKQKLNENGILIISGIVDERLNELRPYITEHWQIREHIKMNNWNSFALSIL